MPTSVKTHYIGLLAGVLCISFSAVFVKLAGVEPTLSAFYRCFYSSIVLFTIGIIRGEHRKARRVWVIPALLGGLSLATDMIIWHKTIIYIGAGPATILANSQVVFMGLIGFLVLKERISIWFPLFIPFIFYGMYLTIPDSQIMVSPGLGFFLGILVGISYTGFLFALRYAKEKSDGDYPEIFSLAVFVAATGFFVGLWGGAVEHLDFIVTSWTSQLYLVLIALVAQSLGWILIKANITRIPSHQGSLMLLVQPMLTMFWGFLILSEPLTPVQITGMVMALGLIALYQLKLAPGE